ncbi:MAG TPA: PmoA family protein [Lacipirellulaceae bacterium]|nr:PmoA family protein [Lacipirellulaceae bacterium]
MNVQLWQFWQALLAAAIVGSLCDASARAAEWGCEPLPAEGRATGMRVTIDGEHFADYLVHHGHQPVIWPIHGPDGRAMTRQFPLGERLEGEADDHPHHRSLWFNHGLVNGLDFWLEPRAGGPDNQIVHREFVQRLVDGVRVVTRNDWTSDGRKVCEDLRTVVFGADEHGRWIDFCIDLTASEGELELGDTKEGSFAVRTPGTMSVDSGLGGRIRNSQRQENGDAWGQSAAWVDYSGPVDGQPAGIAIFDLPDSFRHPGRWHVRTYGLFAANPFGQREFPRGDQRQGAVTVAAGESLRLHYRVLLYAGEKSAEELSAIAEQYGAGSP